jgi:hypothetical protein
MERIAREIRRGGRTVLFVELAVPESPTGAVTVVAPHLENKCKPGCRAKQAAQVLEWIRGDHNPVILGGDLNTTGTDNAPVSVSKVLTDRVKDYDKWAIDAVKWSTGAPTILLVLAGVLIIKELMYRHVASVGDSTGSEAVKSDAWRHRTDALTSGFAFVGISIALLEGLGGRPLTDGQPLRLPCLFFITLGSNYDLRFLNWLTLRPTPAPKQRFERLLDSSQG